MRFLVLIGCRGRGDGAGSACRRTSTPCATRSAVGSVVDQRQQHFCGCAGRATAPAGARPPGVAPSAARRCASARLPRSASSTFDQAFALDHVAICQQLRCVADRPDGDAPAVEEGQVLGERSAADEVADDPSTSSMWASRRASVAKRGSSEYVGAADGLEQASRHAVGGRSTRTPNAVGGLVGVARRGGAGTAAGARLELAGEPEVGHLRAEDRQHRLEQRQVDHLARSALHPHAPQRHHRRAGAVQAGGHVAEEDRRRAPVRGPSNPLIAAKPRSLRPACRSRACARYGRSGPSPRCA